MRANLALIAMAVVNVLVVKPFYAFLRLLGWPERRSGHRGRRQPPVKP